MNNDRLKFRVWNNEDGMYENDTTPLLNSQTVLTRSGELYRYIDFMGNKSFEVPQETTDFIVEQCTGLKDKNGTLIYENDEFNIKGKIYSMFWDKTICGFLLCGEGDWIYINNIDINELEIIGNIHKKASQ